MKTGFLDWTEDSLNLFIFERKGKNYELIESSSLSLQNEPDLNTLQDIRDNNFDNVCLSIPVNLLTLREHNFPFSDTDKIRETIPYELEGILLGSTNDYSIDHVTVESYDLAAKILAVCIEKSRLGDILSTFSSAGLEPKLVTSLDLRLSNGSSEALARPLEWDLEQRAQAAEEELSDPSVNLRRDELSYTGDVERLVKQLRLTAVLIFILAAIFCAHSAFNLYNLKDEHSLLTSEINKTYRSVFPADKKVIDPVRQFKGNKNSLIKKKEALSGIPFLDLMNEVAVINNRSIILHEFNADSSNVILKGTAESFEEVESLKNNLSKVFPDVKVADSSASSDNKITFTIVMQNKRA